MHLPHTPSAFLWRYVKLFRGQFICLVAFMLIWALNESLFPYFLKLFVEGVTHVDPAGSLWENFKFPIVGITVCWLTMEIAMRLSGVISYYLYPAFRAKMREDTFDWVKDQSVDYFSSNLAGSIGAKIADIPKSSHQIIDHFIWYVIAIFFVFVSSIVVVAQASFVFTALITLWCATHMGITFYYLEEVQSKSSDHYESIATLNGETVDIINNASSMKFFSRVGFETQRIKTFQATEIKKSKSATWAIQKVDFFRGFAALCFMLTTISLLLKGWKDGWLSVGDFPLVAMTSFNLLGLIWHMSMTLVDIFQDIGILRGSLSLLRHEHSVQDKPTALEISVPYGEIEFKNVVFGYRKNMPLFSGLSVRIKALEKVGLVGFSGSGKTTFVNLILRAFDIGSGEILIDGQNIANVTQASLREHVTLIPQDTNLFHRSVKENLTYGNLNATDEEIEAAARKAHCHGFIQKLENGYDTVVGERGLKLSGGQRQRLAIARAFLKNTPILLLDEATSALDSETEKDIQVSLLELMANKTTLIVAHRLSTLKHMDRILVFDKGQIIEEGSQKELLKKGGHFAHLWSLQHEGFLPDKE
ncbi:ABC transporter ATP-binding protein [Candidatus Finniella inopinata]|uniref:ABC transporter ATP-binding protein n=1 Tax=Candidatus Finniella inopinata TaxID=1696036 RepID=A0A4Q7DHX4_9PROT|nr:ABC transporter ATP-binding protein [Candidatus Finniella inopinata]RZI45908.1 ABC transporter ATP-binding protein [Candidatus Finniella inopinata]